MMHMQYVFMDMKTYEETRLIRDETWAKYMKEGLQVALIVWNDKVRDSNFDVSSCMRLHACQSSFACQRAAMQQCSESSCSCTVTLISSAVDGVLLAHPNCSSGSPISHHRHISKDWPCQQNLPITCRSSASMSRIN